MTPSNSGTPPEGGPAAKDDNAETRPDTPDTVILNKSGDEDMEVEEGEDGEVKEEVRTPTPPTEEVPEDNNTETEPRDKEPTPAFVSPRRERAANTPNPPMVNIPNESLLDLEEHEVSAQQQDLPEGAAGEEEDEDYRLELEGLCCPTCRCKTENMETRLNKTRHRGIHRILWTLSKSTNYVNICKKMSPDAFEPGKVG